MRYFALLALFLAPAYSDQPAPPDSMKAAAMYALKVSAQLSPYYEYGGQIVKMPDGKFNASFPVTDYSGDSVSYGADPAGYAPNKLVASYHTHPCLPYSHTPGEFSRPDLAAYRAYGRPGYMLDMCTGDVHFSTGVGDEVIGHIDVPGKPLEAKT